MCVSPRRGGHFCSFWSSRFGKIITSQSRPLANNNKNNNGSRRGNLLISSIRSILYAPIAIMTLSREAVCIFWPRGVSYNNRFTGRSSICSRLYAPIDNNKDFAWSCLPFLATTTVSRGAVCIFWPRSASKNPTLTGRSSICSRLYAPIDNNNDFVRDCMLFLLQPIAPGALKSVPGLPQPKNSFFLLTFNVGNALSGAPLRKVIFQAGFPWASVGVSGRICSRLYVQIARIADLFETVRPDCNKKGSVRDCTPRLQK